MMTAKAYEVKLQGKTLHLSILMLWLFVLMKAPATFIKTVKPFTSTDHCTAFSTNLAILVDSLQDPNTKTQFYIAQHLVASSSSVSK
jgi:hypothetical protein